MLMSLYHAHWRRIVGSILASMSREDRTVSSCVFGDDPTTVIHAYQIFASLVDLDLLPAKVPIQGRDGS